MSYSVKQLAKLSGVSVRTLHWYDEIGLLRPAYHSRGGYRQYEEEQLLLLQQILFFRELGFALKEIKRVLGSSDFNRITALQTHRKALENSLERTRRLIETIDKTVLHLRGKAMLKDGEFYYGFDSAKQKAYEKELKQWLADKKIPGHKEMFAQAKKRCGKWDQSDMDEVQKRGEALNHQFVKALEKGLAADSDEVQALVKLHHQWIQNFYDPTKEVYAGLGQLYCEHEEFAKFYAAFHPDLAEFLAKAMVIYAERNL